MSWRIHVLGAYGATDSDFQAALDSIGEDATRLDRFQMGSSGKWQWASASVWNVDGSAIDKALSSLPVPALRVTSSDAVLWMLTLTQPGRVAFRGVHYFTSVGHVPADPKSQDDADADFPANELEDVAGINRFVPELEFLWDAEEAARIEAEHAKLADATVPCLEQYTDYGVTLPAAVIEEMKRRPHCADHTAFMAHGPQIVEALKGSGFDFDPEAMLQLLTVGPRMSIDDSDIGNMPRFLEMLGIEGVFPDMINEPETVEDVAAEADEVAPEDQWLKCPPGELFERFDRLSADCPLTEISGGPVEVAHAVWLHLLTHLLAEDPPTSVRIEFPDASLPGEAWKELASLEVRRRGRQWEFCFLTPHWWFGVEDLEELDASHLTAALGSPPEGTRLELAFLVAGLSGRCHRFAGTYRNQQLAVDQAFPALTADVLTDALALVAQVVGTKSIELADDEVAIVKRNYERSHGEPPRIRKGKIKPDLGTREGVIQTLLFERFASRGPWDIAGAREMEEETWREFERLCGPSEGAEQNNAEEAAGETEASREEIARLNEMMRKMQEATERMQAGG